MLKLIAILTGCSLTLAVTVHAAEPTDQVDPKAQKPKKPQEQKFISKQQQLKTPNAHIQDVKTRRVEKPVINTPSTTVHADKLRKVSPPATNTLPAVQSTRIHKDKQHFETTNQQQLQSSTNQQQFQKNKLNKQTVEKIRAQHRNFHARVNTSIASVKFNQNYQIAGAQNWSKPQYRVFRSYRPQWHDQGWWRSHHRRLSLIGGGWYFWDAGYWYPAWGYDEGAAYYPYDGPIYSGPSARPFDQVVADVQAALQEQGYYRGEVDGLLGPLTRQALAEYQNDQGLYATETIDQPTLESLGLG